MESKVSETQSLGTIIANLDKDITSHDRDKLIKTGFPKFDARYLGFAPGELWVIGGYSGTGKTFFLLQLLLNVIRQGYGAIFFSLEMGKEALVSRLWANVANLDPMQLEWGLLNQVQLQEKAKAKDKLAQWGELALWRDDLYKVESIEKAIVESKPQVVFLDYIQNILSTKDEYQKLTAVSAELQRIAKQYNCTIVAASQVSNEYAKDTSSKVIGFKGSGAIMAACDFGIILDSDPDGLEHEKKINLYVKKCRRGPQRKLDLLLKFPAGRYEEVL